MTRVARVVLQDAKHAIAAHSPSLHSEEFRISWFAVVGLLRAVGHVLDKVDSQSSEALGQAIRERWLALQATRPEPQIFWGFIEGERNRFLKNYEHGIRRTFVSRSRNDKPRTAVDGANSRGGILTSATEVESFIESGPFAGRPEQQVAWEAHAWWATYLDAIDALAQRYERV